jgi:uncharacterized protein (UPF0212 family)
MADYSSCPHCGHSFKKDFMSSTAEMWRCNQCNAVFCYKCNRGSASSPLCPKCGTRDKTSYAGKLIGRN